MRIGYLVPEFPAQTHVFFWREVRALRSMGQDVFLLSTRLPRPLNCKHAFAEEAVRETKYLYPPTSRNLASWALRGLKGASAASSYLGSLERLRFKDGLRQFGLLACAIELVQWAKQHRIDHIHGHSCADSAHVLAISCAMGGPPFSLTLHGDLEVYGRDHARKMLDASFVCTVGSHLRQQVLQQAGVPPNKIIVTCMGVETSKLAALSIERTHHRGVFRLLTVARLEGVKGHIYALGAVHKARQAGLEVHYTIAGEGPQRSAILAKVQELGLENCVTLTGTLAESDVYALLSQSDAFLLPSYGLGEAWPVAVMEAMGAGLPVISTIIGATPEMITSGLDGILVAQKNENEMFKAIGLLTESIETRRRIGDAAQATARMRFDVGSTARVLLDAIKDSSRRNDLVDQAPARVMPEERIASIDRVR